MAGNRRVLNKEEIRERVNRITDGWRSYPGFAPFFGDLLDANKISVRTFAQQYAEATGRRIDAAHLRIGQRRPSYQFVLDVADHGLLSLSDAARPTSEQRRALFAVAGLIEVTPESTRQWNHDVLAGWQRHRGQQPADSQPTWSELMHKLLDFQTQGWRWHREEIAAAANAHAETGNVLNASRVAQLLSGKVIPGRVERTVLADVIGLTPAQSDAIESAIEDGTLSFGRKSLSSTFSTMFTGILSRLAACGITQEQLALLGASQHASEHASSKPTISAWKNGKSHPTVASLRSLVRGLEECRDQHHRPLISPDEIRQLVFAAGFSPDCLTATTHEIIARIDDTTRLKPLLSALRNAADLSVPASAVDRAEAQSRRAPESRRLVSLVQTWEREAAPETPTPEQVRDLLTRYNRLLNGNGQDKLSASEIQRVVVVARRERPAPLPAGFRRITLQHTPLSPRRQITPDLGDGPTR